VQQDRPHEWMKQRRMVVVHLDGDNVHANTSTLKSIFE